ncbi:centriolin protein, partial [Limnohabitans sp.]|uniref:centriolin protein n=1 Tax=Limnohabitans sp. TaxID=1907725 RepID=UPI00286F46CB
MKPLLLSLFAASGRLNRLRNPLVACLGISVLYVIANIFFMGDVIHLIRGAANPFFASLIVVTTVITQVLTIYHAIKLSGETDLVLRIKEAMRGAAQDVQEKQHAVLAQILGTTKNAKSFAAWTLFSSLDSQRSAAQGYDLETLRTHLTAFEDQVARRASFPMHLSNTLIGLGLFGTFLGLIVTLKEVAGLIGLFAAAGNVDSADMMGQFFQKMSGPLAGMGEAFVASLLGLGGSIVTGMQLLSLKKIQSVTNYAAELSYFEVTETIYGPTTTGNDGKGVALDVRLAQLQLEEISALRHDITKQTDAILMASSKMRQASEAMNQVMNSLEKIATQDNIRPNIDQMTVLLDQRLETIVRKLDDTQNVQHGL